VENNKSTQVFKVGLKEDQRQKPAKECIETIHAVAGEQVDEVVRGFADRINSVLAQRR